jgi:hypothetical protein
METPPADDNIRNNAEVLHKQTTFMSLKLPRPAWNKNGTHKYGVWTHGEAAFMDRFLARVGREFGDVRFLEIGVAEGATMAGILERCDELGLSCHYEGVDGECGKPGFLPPNCVFHQGDSAQVFPQIPPGFNILFVDGSHNNNYVCLDFLNYSTKVVVGGYVIFHDSIGTAKWEGLHYQGTGPDIPEFRIAVRMALKKLGLLQGYRKDWQFVEEIKDTEIMGMYVVKKMLPL